MGKEDRPMTAARTAVVAREMERTRARLERWRKGHTGGVPLPEELWAAAARLARRHGVSATARALRLDYTRLKRRSGQAEGPELATPLPRFVELAVPAPAEAAACRIELSGPGGGSVKIELAAPISASLVVELCRAAWGNAR
jgi:hypothetical protein